MSLKSFLQLCNVICNYVIGQKYRDVMAGIAAGGGGALQEECPGAHFQYK